MFLPALIGYKSTTWNIQNSKNSRTKETTSFFSVLKVFNNPIANKSKYINKDPLSDIPLKKISNE